MFFFWVISFSFDVLAQNEGHDFLKVQNSFPHVTLAWKKHYDTLAKEFRNKGLEFPPKDIYLRAFKSQNELELWGRNSPDKEYRLVRVFHICALSGVLGPKRVQGDRQVPEGYYFIDEFNPKSEYYLSMLLSYPNYADEIVSAQLGDNVKLGGDIYIHGGCVTIGCLPMTDAGIQQLYVICMNAKANGQENIPVHIFPTRFTKNSMNYLKREYGTDLKRLQFWNELKEGYDYFEKYHELLPVMYTPDGKYAY